MRPIEFSEQNTVYAKDQPAYQPLPAYKTLDGEVITCWQFTWKERIKIFFSGVMWWRQLTFNQALQPQSPSVDKPFV